MLALSKWGKDKPFIIRIFAGQLLLSVHEMSEEFKTLKLRRFASLRFPLPRLEDWFDMYCSHRKIVIIIKDIFSSVYGKSIINQLSDVVAEFQKQSRTGKRPSSDDPSESQVNEVKEFLELLVSASEKELEGEFNDVPFKQSAKNRMARLTKEKPLEMAFYLFVVVPCWTLYRTFPTLLYRKARQGDFEALEKLLRLDQLMLHDPQIGKQIISYRFNHSSGKYRKLLEAATKSPKGSDSRKNILLSEIALLSAVSHLTKRPLTPQDLYELVEAYDHDSKSNILDSLPEPAALARALSPDRNFWRKFLNPDKNIIT